MIDSKNKSAKPPGMVGWRARGNQRRQELDPHFTSICTPIHEARVSQVAEADCSPREGLSLGVALVESVRPTARAAAAARSRAAVHPSSVRIQKMW